MSELLPNVGFFTDYEQWRADWSVSNIGGPCGRCAALDGQIFAVGTGPQVPLHPHCHCRREWVYRRWIVPAGVGVIVDRERKDDGGGGFR